MATAFVRAANPVWFMVDLVGQPLNDEYYAFFLQNVFPYLPQVVYSDVNGTIPWPNPLQFQPDGTLPNNLYFNADEVYRIEIRHGDSQSDPLIREINDFIPSNGGGSDTNNSSIPTNNQITNSQFFEVNFTSPLEIDTEGTYSVAPGWDFVCEGVGGDATIEQVVSVSDQNQINNPPYTLRIDTNGFSSAKLVQRFNHNGAIWASTDDQDGFVSMSVTASSDDDYELSLLYVPSNTLLTYSTIASDIITGGDFQVLDGTIRLPVSDNTDTSDDAYIDMVIQLQGTGIIELSNIQVTGQSLPEGSTVPDPIVYQQETIERQIDHFFHYYRESIIIQPKESILTGWNFGINPQQFTFIGAPNIATTDPIYVLDQTIFKAEIADSISVSKQDTLNIVANPSISQGQFAIIQYIDPSTINPYWGFKVSSLVRASVDAIGTLPVKIKMRLIYSADLPQTLSGTEPIDSYDANGDPIFSSAWTAIMPENDPSYELTTPSIFNQSDYYSFNKFQLPTDPSTTQTLGIVLYITESLDSDIEQRMYVKSISLVPNDFALDSNVETFDQSLRKCQFYYEKSYPNFVFPGPSTTYGNLVRYMTVDHSTNFAYPAPFSIEMNTVKRGNPIVTLYNLSGGSDSVTLGVINTAGHESGSNRSVSDSWSPYPLSPADNGNTKIITYKVKDPSTAFIGGVTPTAVIYFNYVADSRMGL